MPKKVMVLARKLKFGMSLSVECCVWLWLSSREVKESTIYSTGESECILGIVSRLYKNDSLNKREKYSKVENVVHAWQEGKRQKHITKVGSNIFE